MGTARTKRKTPLQLQSLEEFYSEVTCPTQDAIKEFAAASGLSFKQVQRWFVEKRRKDKYHETSGSPCPSQGKSGQSERLSSRCRHTASTVDKRIRKAKRIERPVCIQDMLFSPEYILSKVFRKDGPPLGVKFDYLPTGASFHIKAGPGNGNACQETPRKSKKRKGLEQVTIGHSAAPDSWPVNKHGMGKGLMTVWRATNPGGGDIPTGIDFVGGSSGLSQTTKSQNLFSANRRLKKKRPVARLAREKLQEKKKPPRKIRQGRRNNDQIQKPPHIEKCKLALEEVITQECIDQFAMLVDDEDLELRELQAGDNPLSCSDNLSSDGLHGCLLGKDLLATFPPCSVKMKHPFSIQPWDSSVEMVKKLFKVFHFIYTYSVMLDINSFTLDEFAQAFHDKDSLLLGEIHLALLKLLFINIEMELSGGAFRHLSRSCKFLVLIHSVDNQESIIELWRKFLNPLTWTEVLRQVLVAAGFGSSQGPLHRETIDKVMNNMRKYGLKPGSLKGELFRLLSEQGSNGLKVSEMARSSEVVGLNLHSATEDLELTISSILSSDITLFEKISSSTYRIRVNFSSKDDDLDSDTEDAGTVDDHSDDSGICSSGDDSECEADSNNNRKSKRFRRHNSKNSMLMIRTEIDESHPGEPWLLGLMEGEYSDLSIEEKLNVLVALIDLLNAGSTIRMEDRSKSLAENALPSIYSRGGAKIKRPLPDQQMVARPSWVYDQPRHGVNMSCSSSETGTFDSSVALSKLCNENFSRSKMIGEAELGEDLHPMQSIFLGSDRRYNRYWLFLGPCNAHDPGHKRVYFESSEDGRWRVIDTEEALNSLFSVLDNRGAREARLVESLGKRKAFICQEMSTRSTNYPVIAPASLSGQLEHDTATESSSPISDVDNSLSLDIDHGDSLPQPGAILLENGKKEEEQKKRWSRLKAFDAWIWKLFYLELNAVKLGKKSYNDSLTKCERCHDLYWRDEKHCKICHTTFEVDFDLEERYIIHTATCRQKGDADADAFPKHKILPSQLQSLKAAVHSIESVMPEGSLIGAWTKSAHRLWVKRLRRTSSVAELLQVLADFIGAINREWLFQCGTVPDCDITAEEMVACFPTIPQTSSAVALWLARLDALLAPHIDRVHSEGSRQPQLV